MPLTKTLTTKSLSRLFVVSFNEPFLAVQYPWVQIAFRNWGGLNWIRAERELF